MACSTRRGLCVTRRTRLLPTSTHVRLACAVLLSVLEVDDSTLIHSTNCLSGKLSSIYRSDTSRIACAAVADGVGRLQPVRWAAVLCCAISIPHHYSVVNEDTVNDM